MFFHAQKHRFQKPIARPSNNTPEHVPSPQRHRKGLHSNSAPSVLVPVTQTSTSKRPFLRNSKTSGQSLVASGRVPNMIDAFRTALPVEVAVSRFNSIENAPVQNSGSVTNKNIHLLRSKCAPERPFVTQHTKSFEVRPSVHAPVAHTAHAGVLSSRRGAGVRGRSAPWRNSEQRRGSSTQWAYSKITQFTRSGV